MIPIEHLLLGAVMALTTYLVRMLPMVLMRRQIRSRFALRFFHYTPYAVLSAMLIPAVFSSTGNAVTAIVGVAAGFVLSLLGQSLIVVSLVSCLVTFLVSFLVF